MKKFIFSSLEDFIRSKRLCLRISNCSRDFLFTWGDRRRVYLDFLVGKQTTPPSKIPYFSDNNFILIITLLIETYSKDRKRIKLSFIIRVTLFFCPEVDLNHRPKDFQSFALTN